jgi:hypothetical protein
MKEINYFIADNEVKIPNTLTRMFFFNTGLGFIGMLKIKSLKLICEKCLMGRHHCFVGFSFDKCFRPKQWRCPYFLCER